jgi:regulator of RNase E activity RraA
MQEKYGYRIRKNSIRPAKELVEKFKGVPTGNIVDAMGRVGAMHYLIKPINANFKMVGTAITVRGWACDNLIVYKAIDMLQEGDIIVIANDGFVSTSTWGDITSLMAREKKAAGMVTDGLVRDIEGIVDVGLPVFAKGSTPNSPYKDGPGEINCPVSCGGVTVNPGDIIVGDVDGVVVVPKEAAEQVAAMLVKIKEKEEKLVSSILAGKIIPEWVEARLKEVGFELE